MLEGCPRFRMLLVLGLALLWALAAPARAEEVWRVAGTFNGWSTADDGWRLTSVSGEPGAALLALEKRLAPGSYRFKFVKDGAWERGHLGLDPATGRLATPGADIPLRVHAEAVYRFTLNPRSGRYSAEPWRVDRTVLDVRVLGAAVVNRPVTLDLRRTLTVDPYDLSRLSIETNQPGTPVRRIDQEGRMLEFVPREAGPLRITLRLDDGGEETVREVSLAVMGEAELRFMRSGRGTRPESVPYESQADGTMRALVSFDEPAGLAGMDSIGPDGELVRVQNVRVPAGVFVSEIRDGAVVVHRDPALPMLLTPGHWRRVTFTPSRPVDRVQVIGDLTGWRAPSGPGSERFDLASRADGSYSAILNLPAGSHRYRLLLDGEEQVIDPNADETVRDAPGGPAGVMHAGPRSEDFPPPAPGAVNGGAVRHDPGSPLDVSAICGRLGLADISLTTLGGDVERVVLNLALGGERGRVRVPMARSRAVGGWDRWTARVKTGEPMALYSFTLIDGPATFTTEGFSASLEPALQLPSWAKGAVWYQIFPERFRNGNPLNDPHGPGVFQMPWTADWYAISPEEEAAWRARYGAAEGAPWPERKGGPLFHVVWDRRYGGDLQGIAEKFGYLRDLGVDAIYMNPIFEAESMHKYDATDFRHIDDNFGTPASAGRVPAAYEFEGEPADPATWTWTPADRYFVDEFLPRAREHGIRVILDGVWNHTGKPFFAFRDIEKNGVNSPYKDWYYCEFDESGRLKSWQSWFDTGALPKFRQTADGDLVPPVKEHIFEVTRRWMDPNGDGDPSDGIDGWRLDVALDVGMPFWRDWRELVKGINPEAVIIAEIWDNASEYLTGDAFDTQMHYPFAVAVTEWLGVRPGMTATELGEALSAAFNDAPQNNLIHQNLFGSHDTDRFASMLLNPGREYDQGNRPQDHDFPYRDERPPPEVYRRSLLGVAIQALYAGAPMVYYGDEVGMWGADDPTDRKPFPWPDKGEPANPDERPDWELHAAYREWLTLRRDEKIGPVLRYGSTRHLDSGDDSVFAFERSLNGVRVIAVVNRQGRAFDAGPLLPAGVRGTVVDGESARYWVVGE